MYPQKLEEETKDRKNWSHKDVFSGGELEYVIPGLHKSYAIGMHRHEFYEVNIVLNGTGRHYIGEGSCEVSAGNVFIIPPHIAHGYYPYSSLDVYHILIHCSYFRRYARELHAFPGYTALFEIEPFLRGVVDKNLFLFLPAHQLQALKEKLELLEQMRGMEYAGKNSMMNAYTLYLIGILSLEMSQLNSDREQDDSDFRFILQSMEYIRAHFSEKLTAEWLGRQIGMSRSTYLRHFSAVCKITPTEYQMICRLDKAKDLLVTTSQTITEIAQECGFYDSSHFVKYFVREVGEPPAAYRHHNAG